jgi:MoaA/NifB/PqqE/SkfB family radical SAM enzyme
LQFILNKLNEDQVAEIKKFCADNHIDRLYIKPFILSGYAYTPEQIKELSDKFFVDKLVDDENVVYEKKDGLLTPKSSCTTCPDVDKVFTVLSDGRAVMCCFDLLGDYVYGEMDKQDLNDLWFSERATLIRDKARNRIFPLCKVCGNVE